MAERNYWDDDPTFTSEAWREDVANGYTRQSYADWIVAMREEALEQKQMELDYADHSDQAPL